jgi:mannose-6-phosphate isomerase-like protein (cupin superfamily)
MTHFFHVDSDELAPGANPYTEFLRVPAMSAGFYTLAQGATDLQTPHGEDELYYVLRGRARMQIGSDQAEVRAGSIIFVEAGREHRFYDIQESLQLLVVFSPAERK